MFSMNLQATKRVVAGASEEADAEMVLFLWGKNLF
jgi:hypothetical protein